MTQAERTKIFEEELAKKVPLVSFYSWKDGQPVIQFFDSEEEAYSGIKKIYDEEIRIEEEEDGKIRGIDFISEIEEDNSYAKITDYRRNGDIDTSTWTIGYVLQPKGEK